MIDICWNVGSTTFKVCTGSSCQLKSSSGKILQSHHKTIVPGRGTSQLKLTGDWSTVNHENTTLAATQLSYVSIFLTERPRCLPNSFEPRGRLFKEGEITYTHGPFEKRNKETRASFCPASKVGGLRLCVNKLQTNFHMCPRFFFLCVCVFPFFFLLSFLISSPDRLAVATNDATGQIYYANLGGRSRLSFYIFYFSFLSSSWRSFDLFH